MPKIKGLETKGFTEVDRIFYCWKKSQWSFKINWNACSTAVPAETQISQGCERAYPKAEWCQYKDHKWLIANWYYSWLESVTLLWKRCPSLWD